MNLTFCLGRLEASDCNWNLIKQMFTEVINQVTNPVISQPVQGGNIVPLFCPLF